MGKSAGLQLLPLPSWHSQPGPNGCRNHRHHDRADLPVDQGVLQSEPHLDLHQVGGGALCHHCRYSHLTFSC